MTTAIKRPRLLLSMLVGLIVSACGAPAQSQPGSDPGAGTDAASQPNFTVCFTSAPSVKDIPAMLAVQALQTDGWSIERRDFEDVALIAQSVASGDCDLAVNAAFQSVLAANEGGAELRILALTTGNEWSLVARPDFQAVPDLEGARVGTFSEASYDRAMIQVAVDNAGVEPQWIYGGGSGQRVQAMLDDQLDATGADATDIVTLNQNPDADFNVLLSFADEIPQLMTNVAFTSSKTLDERGDVLSEFIDALVESYAAVTSTESQTTADAAADILTGTDSAVLSAIVKQYIDAELWPADPVAAITDEAAQFSAEFYQQAGQYENVPDPSSYLANLGE